jgi:prophage antirepressor-like protein
MNEITAFDFEGFTVRVIDRNAVPRWFLVDVCRVLGIVNGRNVSARLNDDEKGRPYGRHPWWPAGNRHHQRVRAPQTDPVLSLPQP